MLSFPSRCRSLLAGTRSLGCNPLVGVAVGFVVLFGSLCCLREGLVVLAGDPHAMQQDSELPRRRDDGFRFPGPLFDA